MFRRWLERWKNWVGDHEMEVAIRDQLRSEGYGSQRRIRDFRLVAIERPGWVCVYDFTIAASESIEGDHALYGVARDDSRRKTVVRLYESVEPRNQQRTDWSEGLILAPSMRR